MTTYRERREQRAERRREWAQKRLDSANAIDAYNESLPYAHDIAFVTQPGHISARAALIRRQDHAFADRAMAAHHERTADEIERQLETAIYDDDEDAPERLRAKIAELEARRERYHTVNRAMRAAARSLGREPTPEEMSALGITNAEIRDLLQFEAYSGARERRYPAYASSNLSGNLSRLRARLVRIEQARASGAVVLKFLTATRARTCAVCGLSITPGQPIAWDRAKREARHATWSDQGKATLCAGDDPVQG